MHGPFFTPYSHEFVRLGACVPQAAVADPSTNADNILDLIEAGDKARIALMVFPELGLSAYAIDDLLFQEALLDEVERQLARLLAASRELFPVFAVGAPLRHRGHLYNCGVVIHRGRLLGVVPKVFLPNYREFYERRHFTSGRGCGRPVHRGCRARGGLRPRSAVRRAGRSAVHVSRRDLRGFMGAAPAEHRCRARRGRDSAQPLRQQHHDRQGGDAPPAVRRRKPRAASRPMPIRRPAPASRRPTSPGMARPAFSKSSDLLAETERFSPDPQMAVADVDLGRIRQERMRTNTFGDSVRAGAADRTPFRTIAFDFAAPEEPLDAAPRGRAVPLCAVGSGNAAGELLRGLQHSGPRAGAAARSRPG